MQTAHPAGGLGAVLLLSAMLTSACASGPRSADERAEAEYRRVDQELTASERFERRKAACIEAGGVLHVPRSAARWQPRPTEMKRAACVRRPDGQF